MRSPRRRSTGQGFTKEPNRFLAEVIRGRKPGAALDLGTVQGRNALFLAAAVSMVYAGGDEPIMKKARRGSDDG